MQIISCPMGKKEPYRLIPAAGNITQVVHITFPKGTHRSTKTKSKSYDLLFILS